MVSPGQTIFLMSHLTNDVDFDAAALNSSIADHEFVICTLKSKSEISKKKSVTFNLPDGGKGKFNEIETKNVMRTDLIDFNKSTDLILLDSGASGTAVADPSLLNNLKSAPRSSDHFFTASGEKINVTHIGDLGDIKNVVCLPNLNSSIASIGQICDQLDCRISFDRHKVTMSRHGGGDEFTVGSRAPRNGLYYTRLNQLRAAGTRLAQIFKGLNMVAPKTLNVVNPLNLIHARCGCSGITTIISGIQCKVFDDAEKYSNLIKDEAFDFCRTCSLAKMKAKPHISSGNMHLNDTKGSHFSVDACGPFSVQSSGGKRYFICFTDRKWRRSFIYFVRSKDEAVDALNEFLIEVKSSCGVK